MARPSKEEAERFFREANEGYAALRQDPEAWAAYEREWEAWDDTLMDGLVPASRKEGEPPAGPPWKEEAMAKFGEWLIHLRTRAGFKTQDAVVVRARELMKDEGGFKETPLEIHAQPLRAGRGHDPETSTSLAAGSGVRRPVRRACAAVGHCSVWSELPSDTYPAGSAAATPARWHRVAPLAAKQLGSDRARTRTSVASLPHCGSPAPSSESERGFFLCPCLPPMCASAVTLPLASR